MLPTSVESCAPCAHPARVDAVGSGNWQTFGVEMDALQKALEAQ